MKCRVHSWFGVERVYEGCDGDLGEDDVNGDHRLPQRVDGVSLRLRA